MLVARWSYMGTLWNSSSNNVDCIQYSAKKTISFRNSFTMRETKILFDDIYINNNNNNDYIYFFIFFLLLNLYLKFCFAAYLSKTRFESVTNSNVCVLKTYALSFVLVTMIILLWFSYVKTGTLNSVFVQNHFFVVAFLPPILMFLFSILCVETVSTIQEKSIMKTASKLTVIYHPVINKCVHCIALQQLKRIHSRSTTICHFYFVSSAYITRHLIIFIYIIVPLLSVCRFQTKKSRNNLFFKWLFVSTQTFFQNKHFFVVFI